jgi:nucleotide-binding universal stress UspA family protein
VLTKDFLNLYALAPYAGHTLPIEPAALGQEEELDTIKAATSRARIPVEVRGIVEDPMLLRGVSRVEARSTDLLLVGPDMAYKDPGLRRTIIETALMSSGVPVLILPADTSLAKIQHAVIGWDGSGEARRAARDLMTLMEPGGSIDIVSVDASTSDVGSGRTPGSNLARLLARHGFLVQVHLESSAGRTTAVTLESFAAAQADLLAIGAFARSRVREILLGGVTRDVIAEVRVPVLLSR